MLDRSKRVKDAKTEAQKEIEDYRKQKDDEFKEFEKKVRAHPYLSYIFDGFEAKLVQRAPQPFDSVPSRILARDFLSNVLQCVPC